MILSIDSWIFDVDWEQTNLYSDKIVSDHCQCGYCRNYYIAAPRKFPFLRDFLSQFGALLEGPDELMPFEPTYYEATYCICGSIVQEGEVPIIRDSLIVTPQYRQNLDYDTDCPAPCFALIVRNIQLPWVLEEDMNEVVSPANEPEYLQRMWDRLLLYPSDETICS